ncbi:uncharacterized protein [Venturia canescens]|uniref:uncharacterized protein n=1 Tax=Venturia canescens TaxID=32260 RepID=UPI001C9BEF61|nr:uncharacterized protein LOC122411334 [Venturia canescens]
MDIIVKTGFKKIKHDIIFQPETVPKGKELVKANHIYNVEEFRRNGQSYLIQAQILRQASVTAEPYRTKLNIGVSRKITNVTCNCVYNKSGKCKHVAALIHYVNNEASLSKTDYEQQWGKPTARQFSKKKYCKGKYFFEMFTSQENVECQPRDVHISELNEPSALRTVILESNSDKNDQAIKNLMESMLMKVDVFLQKDECQSCVNSFFVSRDSMPVYTNSQIAKEELKEFDTRVIVMSKEKILQLCCDTVEQSKCKKWFEARSLRVSSSKNTHSIKSRIKKPVESLVSEMLYPNNFDTASTRYGRDHESEAVKEYQKIYRTEVEKVGLFVSEKQPWLCASLDGVVLCNNSVFKIVEFKCPSSCAKQPIIEFDSKKCNVNYLKFRGNEVYLKESALYYTQCQIQMYVSGSSVCDLFIYSPVKNGSFCFPVHRNEQFLKAVIIKCANFYFQNYLPALHTKITKQKAHQNISNIKKDIEY